jgi:cobalt-zinc-cadmium efflux system protein
MSTHHGHHDHHLEAQAGDRRVLMAVAVNVLLTLAQVIGGLFAGSLSLIADALHNFSDAISLGIAFAARRIARRPSDETMTFGYGRAEVIAALINYTTLIVVGLYLVYEAVLRLFAPQPIEGWLIVVIAAIALAVDAVTAALTYTLSKESMNIRAAFLHNVADALGSIGVIVAGTLIILYDWRIVDPIVTLLIAGYVLWQAFAEIGGTIRLLMLGTPPDLDVGELIAGLRGIEDVQDVHHVHVWAIAEGKNALEAHVVVLEETGDGAETVKNRIKLLAHERFGISHTTLELERASASCGDAQLIGHRIVAERKDRIR